MPAPIKTVLAKAKDYISNEFHIFLITVFILRLPPFYILPFRSFFASSHTLAYASIGLLFARSLWGKTGDIRSPVKTWPIFLYLAGLTLSVVAAINPMEFIRTYKNYAVAIMMFFVALRLVDSRAKLNLIIRLLVVTTFINVIILAAYYFNIPFVSTVLQSVFYDKYLASIENDAAVAKYFFNSYDDALVPVLLYGIFNRRLGKNTRTAIALLTACLFFMVTVSNYRITFVVAFFGLISSLFLLVKKRGLLLGLVFVFIVIGNLYAQKTVGYSSIDRLLLSDVSDVQTIQSRFILWGKATDMATGSPLFGVGLSNYYDNLGLNLRNSALLKSTSAIIEREIESSKFPHNVFFQSLAETGLIGLGTLSVLLLYFLYGDVGLIRKKDALTTCLILSFWGLFISSLTGPRVDIVYLGLFWLLRALISAAGSFLPPPSSGTSRLLSH